MAPVLTDKFGVPLDDIIFNAALGRLDGIETHKIIGNTSNVPGDEILLWNAQTQYVYQTSSELNSLGIASENIGDNASTGQGAHTVKIEGLNADYTMISETVNLTGQSVIALNESFLRINKLTVQTAGNSENNLGNIWIGTGTFSGGVPSDKKLGLIDELAGRSSTGLYSVPNSCHALIWEPVVTSIKDGAIEAVFYKREFGKTFHRQTTQYLGTSPNVSQNIPYIVHAKADVQIRVKDGVGLPDATAGYCNMMLIANKIYGQWGCE